MSPVGYVEKRTVGHVKAASSPKTLAALTPSELKGIAAVVGIGTLITMLRHASKSNEAEVNQGAAAFNAAMDDRDTAETLRANRLKAARRRTEDFLRVAVGRRGLNVMHPGVDPVSPAFITEAASRQRMGGAGSGFGRDRDFFKETKTPFGGVVEF